MEIVVNWILRLFEKTKFYCLVLSLTYGHNLEKLDEDGLKKFIVWFLNQKYMAKDEMLIFYFLAVVAERINIVELEDLIIDSVYFESMPEAVIIDFLNNRRSKWLGEATLLKTYLTSKISDNELLLKLINRNAYVDEVYICQRLANDEAGDKLFYYFSELRRTNYMIKFILVAAEVQSLETLEKFFEKIDGFVETILDAFAKIYLKSQTEEQKNCVIEAVIRYTENLQNKSECYSVNKKYKTSYEELADCIQNEIWPDEARVKLAKKMLALKNLDFICYWFLYQKKECSINLELIDAVLKESEYAIIHLLLSFNNDNYLYYACGKILEKGKSYFQSLVDILVMEYNLEEICVVDQILGVLCRECYEYKLPKAGVFNLICAGSIYTPRYLRDYKWSADERLNILTKYENNEVLLGYFKEFLKTGDTLKLPDEFVVIKSLKRIRIEEGNVKL